MFRAKNHSYLFSLNQQAFQNIYIIELYYKIKGLPQRLNGKEATCNAGEAGDEGLILGWRPSPRRGNGNPLQYSCLKKSHGQRSVVGYDPKGPKECQD